MTSHFSADSQLYIEELKQLGILLGRNAILTKSKDFFQFKSFGDKLAAIAADALRSGRGNIEISTEPNLFFEASLGKGLPKEGTAQVVIGGRSLFSDGLLKEQAINLLILFTPSSNVLGLYSGRTYVVRKIHFDLDRNNISNNKPSSHMQIGGKISDKMVAHTGQVKSETFDQLDLPRIPSPPFGLASVLDMALREFAPPQLQELTNERVWNKLVSRTESILHSSYHEQLCSELSDKMKNNTNYGYHCNNVIGGI